MSKSRKKRKASAKKRAEVSSLAVPAGKSQEGPPVENPVETPATPPIEQPVETPAGPHIDAGAESHIAPPVEQPVEPQVALPDEHTAEFFTASAVEFPVQPPIVPGIEFPVETPVAHPIEVPIEPPIVPPVEPSAESPAESTLALAREFFQLTAAAYRPTATFTRNFLRRIAAAYKPTAAFARDFPRRIAAVYRPTVELSRDFLRRVAAVYRPIHIVYVGIVLLGLFYVGIRWYLLAAERSNVEADLKRTEVEWKKYHPLVERENALSKEKERLLKGMLFFGERIQEQRAAGEWLDELRRSTPPGLVLETITVKGSSCSILLKNATLNQVADLVYNLHNSNRFKNVKYTRVHAKPSGMTYWIEFQINLKF